jgi:hypothetical protein
MQHLSPAFSFAKEKGLLMLLEFDGHACANCRKMEATVFTDPEVSALLSAHFVVAELMVDDKTGLPKPTPTSLERSIENWGDLYADLEAKSFQQNTQPFMAAVTPDGDVLGTLGYEPNPASFKDWLLHCVDLREKPSGKSSSQQVARIKGFLEVERKLLETEGAPAATSNDTPTSSSPSSRSSSCSFPVGDPILKPLGIAGGKSTWKVKASGSACKGEKVTLTFSAQPQAEWHLYSSSDKGEIAYLPTAFKLDDTQSTGVKAKSALQDGKPPKEETDEILGGIVRHFKNGEAVTFTQQLTITGEDPCIQGELTGQVCTDEGMCIPLKFQFQWRPGPKGCE